MYEIGSGGAGVVYLAWHLHLQKYVVLKRIRTDRVSTDQLRIETDILKDLHHPYLPQVYDFVERGDDVFTVMDFIEGTSFAQLGTGPQYMPESRIYQYLTQLSEVLTYLHRHNPPVIHSDIKPENIILRNDGTICLIDFNISVDNAETAVRGFSTYFASPEQIMLAEMTMRGETPGFTLTPATDVYSTGALCYYLITGIRPDGRTVNRMLSEIKPPGYSDYMLFLIDRAMAWNREERYKDGKALAKAVQYIDKETSAYRRYTLMRAAAWIISAVLVAGGAFCLLHGAQISVREHYQEDYRELTKAAEEYRTEDADLKANRILNNGDYQKILKANPEVKAELLELLGTNAFAREEYSAAAGYFNQGIEALQNTDGSDRTKRRLYMEEIRALLGDGETLEATNVINRAKKEGMDGPELLLADADIQNKIGKAEKCLQIVSAILEYPDQAGMESIKADACLLAAEVLSSSEAEERDRLKEQWLQKAIEYDREPYYLRTAAKSFYEMARSNSNENRRVYYGNLARDCYKKLSDQRYPEYNDCLNYALLSEALGAPDECIRILQPYYEQGIRDYRIGMYIAFAYDDLQNSSKASEYAAAAYSMYSEGESSSGVTGEDREALNRLGGLLKG